MTYDIDEVLRESIRRDASDIHITAGRPISYRVNGDLVNLDEHKMRPDEVKGMIDVLLESVPNLKEPFESEGDVDFAYSLMGESRFRVNLFKQRGSVAGVLRRLPFDIPRPENLGIPASVMPLTSLKRGLVLVTGATGSGKSTTLASLIMTINRRYKKHIITIEDPIEYLHRHDLSIVNQRELGTDTMSFSSALRSALREDPDVILVGEMRDLETISTAITAAETGHLVFSTLHTNTAATTVDRLIDVFPPYQQQQIRTQLANVLEGIICQQLIPEKEGHGRVAAFEVMFSNPAIRNLIRENKTFQLQSQLQINKKNGMQTMDDSLYDLYIDGRISSDYCIHFAVDQEAMMKKIIL